MVKYFNNRVLLENTLLPYFCNTESLNLINRLFSKLNYEKYLTYLQPHGIVETYCPNTKFIIQRVNYINGEMDGLSEEWFDNDKLSIKCNYKNGKLDGLFEEWYENGQLWIRQSFKNNNLEGLSEVWYDNGQLDYKANYKNGNYDGLFEEWYDDGKLYIKCIYKDRKLDGLYEEYFLNGQIHSRCNYINGICDSTENWYLDGEPMLIENQELEYA
jgi:antitoxin component YwqK of YwqJK toxin-antitoxin module